ncbi:MAG: FtsQ-type POTRA domain-containing protein [Gemmatimonadaceae bacterium]|nr:FtsQ-type POTRA domain-containing protein [Gemmatimonadaceae bacterium]MCW5824955.1 FtsQ-type POTRA domain-containing protein [Gemmatimonadaceae bacterium]
MDGARTAPPNPADLPRWRRALRAATRITILLALVSSPFWGRTVLRSMDFFRVRRVELQGVRYATPDEIVSRLGVDTLASVWDDVSPLEARVAEHPQVRSVRIRRKLPGTLVVVVTENPPVALVATPRGLVVTDADGDSLPVDPTTMDVDLPVLARKDLVLLRLLAETQVEEPALFARVSEAGRTERGELLLQLPEFRILADSTVHAARLAEVLPVELDAARRNWRPRELDLRFRDQVIVRLQRQ